MEKKPSDDLEVARRVIREEGNALLELADRIGEDFQKAVDLMYHCEGKVVVTGMGKSGHICRKIAATMASTGTSAFFMHPAEGVHGDLGMISGKDVLLALSNSGETEELLNVIPTAKRLEMPVIAMVSSKDSSLAKLAQVTVETGKITEACTLGLAPTTSTTVALALGDALAVALLEKRGFSEEDFAVFHPSGALGRKLLLRVEDLMVSGKELPKVSMGADMRGAIFEMTTKHLGITGVVAPSGKLVGCITDGDLRRGLEKYNDLLTRPVTEVMTPDPKMISREALASEALARMQKSSITSMFVHEPDQPDNWIGILHLHEILRAGLA